MKPFNSVAALLLLTGCVYDMSIHSRDGEKLTGQYRFARENTGLMKITDSDAEVFTGNFITVERGKFISDYTNTFGSGTIIVDGPDLSAYGNAFRGVFGNSRVLTDAAYGETFSKGTTNSETAVKGPLFYWVASLRGNKGATMGCYFIGSSYTGHGFGRCKTHAGKEYSAEF
jgi:hypothetical protein